MAFAYTGNHETFVAKQSCPPPGEALLNLGDPMVLDSDKFGPLAIECIKARAVDSEIIVGDSDEDGPSHLELRNVVAVIIPVSFDEGTGEIRIHRTDPSRRQAVINGTYTGPNSELSIQ